jgi:hypothetical protein
MPRQYFFLFIALLRGACKRSTLGTEETKPMTSPGDEIPTACPDCEATRIYRRLCDGTIVLYCPDCTSVWLDKRSATMWDGAASAHDLAVRFDGKFGNLFRLGRPATRDQVAQDPAWSASIGAMGIVVAEDDWPS